MKNYFKINYIESILLIIGFIALNFFNIILRKLLIYIDLPESMIFSISYTLPFIFLFLFISHQAQKKSITIDLSMNLSPWYIYFIIFCMMFCMIIINEYISSLVPKEGPILGNMYKEIEEFLKEEIKNTIPFFSTTVLLAPICEEVLFRGIILNGMLKNKIHPIKAILFSSFLFGLTHMNPWQFVGGILIGSFIGFIYFITSSIIDCILLHIFNNAFAIFTMFLFMKNKNFIVPKKISLDINFGLILIISFIIVMSGSIFLLKKKRESIKN
ncbi:CAAX Amino Terminal Protease Family Protein [Blattabacterium sp. (Nauphoeta cinerea)]|uniref:CPBP family intramembrane glutamic endopeptidase n=1 Tax=Blattabacterium sp. (Nauphoeta cinerea) TaxID=1316444 RepID=UPI0003B02209|nr:type II CAAX endopeptidase family protein [Blattabacterium sp. (Nauphoeta cinerea)]AGW85817.1 CAAX Amino Terminal Protease Family Protein [Blattabacterium sp. (Nauphoeta cinerea)]